MSTSLPQILLPPRTLYSFIALHQTITITPTTTSSSSTSLHSTNSTPSHNQHLKMPFRSSRRSNMVETRTTKPTLMTRLRGRNAKTQTVKTTTTVEPRTTAAHHHTRPTRSSRWGRNTRRNEPIVHHRRHASVGDKISGAMMKLKGSLTRRPGVKVCSPLLMSK
jgi:hypothetical protein